MSKDYEVDEIITVSDDVEKGYFYLENREFQGPFDNDSLATKAAKENCQLSAPGECRAIYHGSVRKNHNTNLREPLRDMRQTDVVVL